MIKKIIYTFLITGIILLAQSNQSKAQSAELIGGNILNGAVTGTVLGAATMGLQNTNDLTALRIGLGSGILGGAGLAIYDVATLPQGQQFFISGIFNDGTNSSVIILLDTFYGAAVGAALSSAVMLIANKSLLDGLQYGTSAGAWVGFGFGLLDSFVIAERNRDFLSDWITGRSAVLEFNHNNTNLNFFEPGLISYINLASDTAGYKIQPSLNVISFRKSF